MINQLIILSIPNQEIEMQQSGEMPSNKNKVQKTIN